MTRQSAGAFVVAVVVSTLAAVAASPRAEERRPPDAALEREFGFLEAEDIEKIPLSVVSRGPAIAAGQAPAVVDVITAEEIRTSGARTLAELLAQRVGIDVAIDRVVPRGLNTSPSVAGTTLTNHRSLLLVDGRPTNGLFFGEFLAGRELPLEHIERIEIIRGPGSALYGTNAMAGVINVVTKDYADEPGPGVIGEYGSFETRRVDGFAGAGRPRMNGNFFLRYFATGGADQIDHNDNQRQYFGFARGTLGPITIEGEGLDFARENPGLEGAPTVDDHTNRSRYSFGARIDQPIGENMRLSGRAYSNLYQTRVQVREGDPDRSTYDERRIGEELSLNYRPFDWLSVTFGGEARQERGEVGPGRCVRSSVSGVSFEPGCKLSQRVYAAFLEDQIVLPWDVTLTAGFRYDDVSTSGERVNPRFNAVWKASPRTSVKVGYGEAFRAPSFFELRAAQQIGGGEALDLGGFAIGNPKLEPEVVKTVEGEIDHSISRAFNVRLSAFYTHGENLITQQSSTDLLNTGICPPCGVRSEAVLTGLCEVINGVGAILPILTTRDSCFVNAVRVDVYGIEAAVGGAVGDLPIPGEISYGVNYTYQDSSSRQVGIHGEPDLPLAPRHKANVLFDYRPIPELSIFSHTRVVGRQFADGVEKVAVDRYVNEDVNLVYRLSREIDLGVGLYNIAGDRRKEDFAIPREPRTVLGSIAYRFVPVPALPHGLGGGAEPAELGQARAAVERARAAGAEDLGLMTYREALAHLLIAEELQRKGAGRDRVLAASEMAKRAADLAREAAVAAGPVKPKPTPAEVAPTPQPTPVGTPIAKRTPKPKRTPVTGPETPLAETEPPLATPTPLPTRPTPTPRPTATPRAEPTRVPTQDLSSRSVLLLQSDGGVAVYRDTATRLAGTLSARVELRDAHGDREQAIEAARESSADLVIAVGSLAASACREERSDRPVLFCAVLNPGRYNLKGPNLGGVSFEVSPQEQLDRLHLALPRAERIGVIYDPAKSSALVEAAEQHAARLGLRIVKSAANEPRDVDPAFRSIKRDIDVLWLIPDSTVVTRESFEVLALGAAENRIPFVSFSEAFAQQGALLSFYPDPDAVGQQCAELAKEVLRGDRTPSSIGVRAPDIVRTAVNRRVEDQLGVRVNSALQVDKVFQ